MKVPFWVTVLACTIAWIMMAAALRWSYVETFNAAPRFTPEQRNEYARAFMRLQLCTYIKTLRDNGFRNGKYEQNAHEAAYLRAMRRHFPNAEVSNAMDALPLQMLLARVLFNPVPLDQVIEERVKLNVGSLMSNELMQLYPLRGSLNVKVDNECSSGIWGARLGMGPQSSYEMWRTGQRMAPTPGMTPPSATMPARAEPRCCPCPAS